MSNSNSISYRRVDDYLFPNLILPTEEANIKLGKWGILHKDYLLKHKKVVFTTLLAKGKLWQILADIDTQAQQMFNNFVEQIKKVEGVSEQLKAENQIEWVQRLNNIQQRSTENVLKELIYK